MTIMNIDTNQQLHTYYIHVSQGVKEEPCESNNQMLMLRFYLPIKIKRTFCWKIHNTNIQSESGCWLASVWDI